MNKEEFNKRLAEWRRLYEEEGLSASEVGQRYGVTKEAVYYCFRKAGIERRALGRRKRRFERETIIRLYVEEKRTITEISNILASSLVTVGNEIARHGIGKRSGWLYKRKYPQIYQMKIGESLTIENVVSTDPFRLLYKKARRAGIRISIKRIDENTFQVTRTR